jgi:hypothetical protein
MMPLADFVWAPMVYAYTYAVWWVVVAGLVIEGVVYFIAWGQGFWRTVALTLGVNIASAIGGVAFCFASQVFLDTPSTVMIAFVWSFAPLMFALTVFVEYFTGVFVFSLSRSWRTLGIFAVANVFSVGLAVYETLELARKALRG